MIKSTSTANSWQLLSVSDVLTKQDEMSVDARSGWLTANSWDLVSVNDVSTKQDKMSFDTLSGWWCSQVNELNKGIWDVGRCLYAPKGANLRRLGRTNSNETAEPEARQLSNEYTDWVSRIEGRVREFASLSADWDGDGAKEIPLAAVYASLNFIDEVKHRHVGKEPRSAAPSPDGEIALYWHSTSGYAEINFDGEGKHSLCWGDDNDEIEMIEEDGDSVAETGKSRVWDALSNFLEENYRST